MAIQTTTGAQLFAEHVERFNEGVRSGDFGRMVSHFSDDARLVFEGIPVGPFEGREAVAAAYRDQPPDDEIDVLSVIEPDETTVVGRYAWRRDRTTGTMTLTHR